MTLRTTLFLILFFPFVLNSQGVKYIVAADGSASFTKVQDAIDACPENERSVIFIKNGVYNEQVTLGNKTATSAKIISLIGESAEGVVITHSQSRASSGSPTFEDVCTVKLYANDFYAENLTISNTAGNTGMAEALYTAGDRQTFKNCRILGYQDTYRSKKGTRGYFKNCWIEGAVDFIYAGGVLFFDDCTINCIKGGGYITAPEDAISSIPKSLTECQKFLRIGFFFRNCNITANSDVPDNSFYLGRPWNIQAGSYYLNCKLGKHIHSAGWKDWNGNETTSTFAEYNSMDKDGYPVNIANRVSWSFQLPKADVDNLMSPEAVYGRVSSTLYDPITFILQPSPPNNINIVSGSINWDALPNVAGYLVYKNNRFLAAVTENHFSDGSSITDLEPYTFYSISTNGVLSEPTKVITGIDIVSETKITVLQKGSELVFSEPVASEIYNLSGKLLHTSNNLFQKSIDVHSLQPDIYIVKCKTNQNISEMLKFQMKRN